MSDTRSHWVFFQPCGCPFGVSEFKAGVETSFRAFVDFYEDPDAEAAAVARGVTVELLDHVAYEATVYPRMRSGFVCPHQTAGADR